MIDIYINGDLTAVDEKKNLAAILAEYNFNCARVAVAVNSEFVSRGDYGNFFLSASDKVDVVAPVAGG